MKNPSFEALHSPLRSQSEMQGRKPEEEIQQPAFSQTSQEWGRILWNPWQCKLKLKCMKNPNFGALHSSFPSQSEMQGRKQEEKIQQLAFSHGYAKILHCMQKFRGWATAGLSEGQILHTVRNFTHHAKPQEAAKEFCTLCEISHGMQNLLVHQLRYIFISNIWCNFLVSPCNQPRYFLLYIF